jgi:hypothetical protein
MGVVVPILLFICLATLVLATPRFGSFRARRRTRVIADELRSRHGFGRRDEFTASVLTLPGPPFHYGASPRLLDQVVGTHDGRTLTSAGYSCRYNGSTHFYGIVLVELPSPIDAVEVRHGQAFHSVRVVEPVPGGRVRSGVAEFDNRYETYAADPGNLRTVLSATGVSHLLAAPEPFSWRAEGTDLLLWRSGGWSSADALLGCVRAVTCALRPALESGAGLQRAQPTQ